MIRETTVPESFLKCVKHYVKSENATYGEAISEMYQYMNDAYRNEYFYKNTIFNQILLKKHSLQDTAALTELPIADSKADFIMINGKGIVYEIKTGLDNFTRLKAQIEDYYKVFSLVNVVVSYKQFAKAKEILDGTSVGIYVLYDNGNILCRKKAVKNNSSLCYDTMFRVLRKKEFESIIIKYFKKLPEVNSFIYYRTCFELFQKIDIVKLQKEVMKCLKLRTLLVADSTFKRNIPYELRFYAYFTKENHNQLTKVEKFWGRRMEE